MYWKELVRIFVIGILFALVAWLLTGSPDSIIIGMLIIYMELRNIKLIKGGRK